jgi:hypothetical protein
MPKRFRDLFLGRQIVQTKIHGRIAKTKGIGESKAKQWLMPQKNHPHACLIDHPQPRGNADPVAFFLTCRWIARGEKVW